MKEIKNKYVENRLGTILLKLMWLALLLVPCVFVFFRIGQAMMECWDRHGVIYIVCASIGIIAVAVMISRMFPSQLNRKQRMIVLLVLFCLSMIVRTFTAVLLHTTPQSDFATCYRYATAQHSESDAYFLSVFPYLGAYAVTLRSYFALFPATVFSAQVMNAIATSCIPIFLFLGVEKAQKNPKQAVLAGLIYALYPALIIYTAIPSCEHFSQLFFALGFYLLACEIETPYEKHRRKIMMMIATGVAFGIMCVYKELFIIAVPALLMSSFCYEFIPAIVQRVKTKRKDRKIIKIIARNIILVVVVFTVYKLSAVGVQLTISGETYDRNDPIMVPVYRGLALEGRGGWNENVNNVCSEVREECASNSEVNKILMQKLISEYQGNLSELFAVIRDKMHTDFCNEGVYWYWTFGGEETILQTTWVGELLGALFPSAFFMVMCGMMVFGLVGQILKRKVGNQCLFFVTGVVFLFVILLVLMEAQGRYKSNIMPYFCILFSLSIESYFDIAKRIKGEKKIKSDELYTTVCIKEGE